MNPVEGAIEAMISRLVQLGDAVRVELELAGGRRASARLTRDRVQELELVPGDIVYATVPGAREPCLSA